MTKKIKLSIRRIFKYLIEAVLEVFSPNHDDYPVIGVQPFSGEIRPENYLNG
ncbi:hypothetical protein NIES4102_31450 [Chondrocystis sp. NIES-4102]|nr:hypothetical protein NIES4102_31450 [Chondrocystis sp. NIES-4102]